MLIYYAHPHPPFHCMHIPQFLYQFICWLTSCLFGLLPPPGCCEGRWDKHVCVYISSRSCFEFFWMYTPKMELLDHVVILFLSFWGPSILFSIMVAPFYIPINKISIFSTSWPTFVIFCSFDSDHPDGYDVISHCGFYFHFRGILFIYCARPLL